MNTNMKFSVTGQRIELTEPVMLVAGTMNIYTASFVFDAAWDGYTKTAVFRGGDVEREQLLTDDSCEVPWEVLLPGAYLKVGVYGTRDGSRLPTIWTERTQYINSGAGPTDEAAEPSPTLVEQLTAKVGNLDALKTEDKSSVVAAVNEIWASGGGGSGASVTDAAINEDGHLIITLSTGKQIDAGYAVGPAGADGQDGANGKSAYQYAKDGGYTGTEAEFAAKMAAEIPAVDTTLTESGKAADAAAVGARLSSLSEEIANLQTSGLTTEQINALDGMFKACAFTKADVSAEYTAFKIAFGIADSGDGGETEVTLTSISATYDGGDVAVGTAVADLTGLVVTAHYSDGTSQTVTGYTLSGTIAEGSNTVTVTYQGKTATFTVTGVAESGGGDEPVDTTAKIAGTGYGLNSKGGLQSLEKACYTEFYSFGRTIEGSDFRKVIYYVSTGNQGGMAGADKQTVYQDGEFVTYWTTKFDSVNENNFTGNYGPFNQLRFSLVTAYIDDDYAYFADTGEVIFAGKNTQYYGMANIDGTMAVKV